MVPNHVKYGRRCVLRRQWSFFDIFSRWKHTSTVLSCTAVVSFWNFLLWSSLLYRYLSIFFTPNITSANWSICMHSFWQLVLLSFWRPLDRSHPTTGWEAHRIHPAHNTGPALKSSFRARSTGWLHGYWSSQTAATDSYSCRGNKISPV